MHRDCHAKSRPGPRPGSGSTGDSPEAQAGARGTEEGTGRESKEEEKKGQPGRSGPCSGKMTGAVVHFSTIYTARPPKRIAARAASH